MLWRLRLLRRQAVGRSELVDDDAPSGRETPASLAHTFDVAVLDQVALSPVDRGHGVLAQRCKLARTQAVAHSAVSLGDATHHPQSRAHGTVADARAPGEWCGVSKRGQIDAHGDTPVLSVTVRPIHASMIVLR